MEKGKKVERKERSDRGTMRMGEEPERRAKHYSSFHQTLLVGDGDFSFSLSLALSFRAASNIVASSLDPYDVLIKKYKNANSNVEHLKRLGAMVLHGVDATNMKLHPDLKMRKFDWTIFNFPHAVLGFHGKEDNARLIRMHRTLVHGFLRNARAMLRGDGEIHVNHKTTAPFSHWNLEELASGNSLVLIERIEFRKEHFPGYDNKRGDGARSDEPFPLGECSTYKFSLYPTSKKIYIPRMNLHSTQRRCETFLGFPMRNLHIVDAPSHVESSSVVTIRNECSRIFHAYLSHVVETFGRNETEYEVVYSVHEGLRLGFEMYMGEAPGRLSSDFVVLLEELHRLCILRSAWLQKMLYGF